MKIINNSFLNVLLIVFLFLFCNCYLTAQTDSINANRILNDYKQHENEFISVIKDSLKNKLSSDSIAIKNNIRIDSNYFEQFTYVIIPMFYLNSDAEDFSSCDNFFNFLKLDTINFECYVYLFLDDSLYYYVQLKGPCGYCLGNNIILPPTFSTYNYCFLDDAERSKDKYYIWDLKRRLTINNFDLIFIIKGFDYGFLIYNNRLHILCLNDHEIRKYDPNQYIIETEGINRIREKANNCKPINRNSFYDVLWYKFRNFFRKL